MINLKVLVIFINRVLNLKKLHIDISSTNNKDDDADVEGKEN